MSLCDSVSRSKQRNVTVPFTATYRRDPHAFYTLHDLSRHARPPLDALPEFINQTRPGWEERFRALVFLLLVSVTLSRTRFIPSRFSRFKDEITGLRPVSTGLGSPLPTSSLQK